MQHQYHMTQGLVLLVVHFTALSLGQKPEACNLPMDEGQTGNNPSVRFYYDKPTDRCKIFAYRGAGGNANRFAADKACMKNCSDRADETYPEGDRACLLPKDPGECKGRYLLFYFDLAKKKCKTFLYGGCGGNGNRFLFSKICAKVCATKMEGPPGEADDESEVNEALVVGLGMGCAVVITLIVALAVFLIQRTKRNRKPVTKYIEDPLTRGIEMK
ncbi:BPTI/Kunitz domain-containing protein [Mobula hypostoma]|uniref:BPTI/Kunitz domain-containing protein n=1 Tax=Mobula hypostoma TaxID=723540 RepID=UPI002FC2EF19